MYECEKSRSAKNQGTRERQSANAKARNLRPKKERESASAKSYAKERKSASAKLKKKHVPSSGLDQVCTGLFHPFHTSLLPVVGKLLLKVTALLYFHYF
jgi:hypothetical protein